MDHKIIEEFDTMQIRDKGKEFISQRRNQSMRNREPGGVTDLRYHVTERNREPSVTGN